MQKNGCILSDGLWTREERPGYVVNLHSENLPKLTVDRKEIIEYDKLYVKNQLLRSANDLLAWGGLDLRLIWRLSKENPFFASHIVEKLNEANTMIPLNAWDFDNYDIQFSELGCYEPDRRIAQSRYGISLENVINFHIPYWLLPYRLMTWQDQGWFDLFQSCMLDMPEK